MFRRGLCFAALFQAVNEAIHLPFSRLRANGMNPRVIWKVSSKWL